MNTTREGKRWLDNVILSYMNKYFMNVHLQNIQVGIFSYLNLHFSYLISFFKRQQMSFYVCIYLFFKLAGVIEGKLQVR